MIVEIKTVHLIPLGALMKEQKMSDRKLAELSGVHFTHISKLRTEQSRTTVLTAKKLLKALGASDDVLENAV